MSRASEESSPPLKILVETFLRRGQEDGKKLGGLGLTPLCVVLHCRMKHHASDPHTCNPQVRQISQNRIMAIRVRSDAMECVVHYL